MKNCKRTSEVSCWGVVAPICLMSLSLGLFLISGATTEASSAPVSAATGSVSGGISDSAGHPLAEAFVTLAADPPVMQATVVTRNNGTFSVELPAGLYKAVAELRGYAKNDPKPVVVRSGQKAEIKIALHANKDGMALESQISGSELLSLLPEEDRKTLIHRCAACHSMAVLGGKRLNKEGWEKIVQRMSLKEPGGRGEADTLAPWEQNPWSGATEVLVKHFSPGAATLRYDPFPIHNTPDHLSKVVVKEYRLKRPETNVHDITLDTTGRRIWYDDQESGEVAKTGWFGWYDPLTMESKEYQVPQCPGFGGRILGDRTGRVWVGCKKALAYWSPETDQITVFPMDKYGMRELWTVDSNGDAYTILRGRNVDPNGDPKYSFIGKFNTHTKEWTLFKVPTPWGNPYEVAPDSKDNIWFTEIATDKIGKLDPRTGTFTEYPVPTKESNPRRFAIDSKDNVWFTEYSTNKIGMVDPLTGKVTEYEVPTPNSIPYACSVDKNDVVWFSEIGAMRLARFDLKTKTFREYPIPDRLSSMKKLDFTYSGGKEIVWASDRTGPTIIEFDIPNRALVGCQRFVGNGIETEARGKH